MRRVPVEEMNVEFSRDGTEAYVFTEDKEVLQDKDRIRPEEALLYMDLETGKGYHPKGLNPRDANKAARKIMDEKEVNILFNLEKDQERWEEEFRDFLDYGDINEPWENDLEDSDNEFYF